MIEQVPQVPTGSNPALLLIQSDKGDPFPNKASSAKWIVLNFVLQDFCKKAVDTDERFNASISLSRLGHTESKLLSMTLTVMSNFDCL